MTSTDRLAEMAAEALAEVARMGQRIAELETINAQLAARIVELEAEEAAPRWARELIEKLRTTAAVAEREAERHISRLQVHITELETAAAITFGTLAQPTPDEPATITHDIPPNAPR